MLYKKLLDDIIKTWGCHGFDMNDGLINAVGFAPYSSRFKLTDNKDKNVDIDTNLLINQQVNLNYALA